MCCCFAFIVVVICRTDRRCLCLSVELMAGLMCLRSEFSSPCVTDAISPLWGRTTICCKVLSEGHGVNGNKKKGSLECDNCEGNEEEFTKCL